MYWFERHVENGVQLLLDDEQLGARIDWAKTLLALAELDSSSDDFTDTTALRARLKQVVDLTTRLRLDADRAVALNLSAQLSN